MAKSWTLFESTMPDITVSIHRLSLPNSANNNLANLVKILLEVRGRILLLVLKNRALLRIINGPVAQIMKE